MSHTLLREQATQLRLEGQTYRQIRTSLGIPKATLSNWLSKLPLSKEQLIFLENNKASARDLGTEKYIETCKLRRLKRLRATYSQQYSEIIPLSEKELLIAGLFLYWGEGEKRRGPVTISNTDPRIIKFSLFWMTNILKVPLNKITVLLHLYRDMNIEESIEFWSNTISIPKNQFNKPYIKKSNRENLTYKGFGHGTCKLQIFNVILSEKIAMAIKSISDQYGAKDEVFWYN